MTRTNKWTVHESRPDAKYFTHNGNFGENPAKVKREGSGKANWGKAGDELTDLVESGEIKPVFNKQRRGSNSQKNQDKMKDIQGYHV
ncbi:Tma10p NDAI_0J01690 [Naumovozyma dairenensis CBS 421]|uniref:Hyaluronan/mRNA-binding protein domain-containing protein n=1 Tax=Naumovozyma dairenensis (strain ATCC 10597 / BCRC 20456 / CBS 421 / NBRC 0211 / NRRL Y-12639) TaxID=1071378 RepID=G0WGY3_NAUDC|nr:hypothetical protein NDAI_0J01690 [Naumovozyma dairenensis CBS 421]CCD27061.1 hypothetical protein NDAI_0J01690 [Naumovozyma dairenensis CBS 421]